MRTLTEKYNGVLEGRYAKAQFLRDARLAHPQFITQFNGYDDAVSILKNRGMISEAKSKFIQLTVTGDKGATVAKYFHPVEWLDREKHPGELGHYLNAWVKNMTPMEDEYDYVIRMSQGVQQPDEDAVEITEKDLEDAKKIKATVQQHARDLQALGKKLGSHKKAAAQLGLDPHKYNRGIEVNEAEIEEVNENVYKDVAEKIDTILPDSVRRGLDFELEKAGFDTVNVNFDEATRMKHLKKAVDRLSKDPNYYLNQLSGDSSRTKKHDREVEVDQKALFKGTVDPKGGKAEGNTDTFNAMKKAQLREAVKAMVVQALDEGTEKLEKYVTDTHAAEYERMYPKYRTGVKELMNVVLDIEKAFVTHREKVEKAFDMIGHLKAPGVAKSFVAELVDVLRKYQNIPLPSTPTTAMEVPMEEEEKQLA